MPNYKKPPFGIGTSFKYLTIVDAYKVDKGHARLDWYTLQCRCGSIVQRSKSQIKGRPDAACASCAARMREANKGVDGRSYTAMYRSWKSMCNRCKNAADRNYGGRGIAVCDRWLSFDAFVADMGQRPKGMQLDRIDNTKGYYKENCRWATAYEQALNRRTNRVICFADDCRIESEWCTHLNLSRGTVGRRIDSGWPVEKACSKTNKRSKGA